jgi:hypothetical protein
MSLGSYLCPLIHRALPLALPGQEKDCHGLFGGLPFLFCPDCQGLDRRIVSPKVPPTYLRCERTFNLDDDGKKERLMPQLAGRRLF